MAQKMLSFAEYSLLVKKFFPKGLPFTMEVRLDQDKFVKDESLTYLKRQLEGMEDGVSKPEKAQGKQLARKLREYISAKNRTTK